MSSGPCVDSEIGMYKLGAGAIMWKMETTIMGCIGIIYKDYMYILGFCWVYTGVIVR